MPNYVVDVRIGARTYSYVQGAAPDPAADTWVADGLRIGWRRSLERWQPEPMTCAVTLLTTRPASVAGITRGAAMAVEVYADTARTKRMATFYGRAEDPQAEPTTMPGANPGDPAREVLAYTFTGVDYMAELGDYSAAIVAAQGYYWWNAPTPDDPEPGAFLDAALLGMLHASGRFPSDTFPVAGNPTHPVLMQTIPSTTWTRMNTPREDGIYNLAEWLLEATKLTVADPAAPELDTPAYSVVEPWIDPATKRPWTVGHENFGLNLCLIADRETPYWWEPPYRAAVVAGVVQLLDDEVPAASWLVPGRLVTHRVKWGWSRDTYPNRVELVWKVNPTLDGLGQPQGGNEVVTVRTAPAPNGRVTRVVAAERLQAWDAGDGPNALADLHMPPAELTPTSAWEAESFTVRCDSIPNLLTGLPWIPDHARREPPEANLPRTYYEAGKPVPYRRHAAYEAPVVVDDIAPGWHPDGERRYVGLLTSVDLQLADGHVDVSFSLQRRLPGLAWPGASGKPVQALTSADVLADPQLAATTSPQWAGMNSYDLRLTHH